MDFKWGLGNTFAILDRHNEIVITNTNGEIIKTLAFDFYVNDIFGGTYLGISSEDFVVFYDWDG